MLAIQLPTGKTVFLTVDEWLNMTDESYQNLIADQKGFEIEDPFSKILDKSLDIEDRDLPNIPEELEEIKRVNGKKS